MKRSKTTRVRQLLATPLLALVALVALALLLRPPVVAAATASTTTVLPALHDTYVDAAFPATNFGASMLQSGHNPDQELLAWFDVSTIPPGVTIVSAKLYLNVVDVGGALNANNPQPYRAARVDGGWDEATVTYNSKPAVTIGGAPTQIDGVGVFSWDVTTVVDSWFSGTPNHGLAVIATGSGDGYTIYARGRELGDAPRLEITYDREENANAVPDLGDAPDSTNHPGLPNTAYPGPVLGRFHTVWDSPVSGPRHADARPFRLGMWATAEIEADGGPDSDGVNNILNGGADVANMDRADDGWLNRGVSFYDCRPTTLRVRVSRAAAGPLPDRLYLNVWFDGSHDGDWNDMKFCNDQGRASEWIVRDYAINPAAIPAGGFVDLTVNTLRVLNDTPDKAHWVRFSLSEGRAVRPPAGGSADGRGPQNPNQWQYGETEDYYYRPQQPGQPGTIDVVKSASIDRVVTPGDVYTYSLTLSHSGGNAPAGGWMTDTLPAHLLLAGRPRVTATSDDVAPLYAQVHDRTVIWRGVLPPEASLTVHVPVRVRRCFTTELVPLVNTVYARQTDGSTISNAHELSIDCSNSLTLSDITVSPVLTDRLPVMDDGRSMLNFKPVGFDRQLVRVLLRNNGEISADLALRFGIGMAAGLDDDTGGSDTSGGCPPWCCLTCTRTTADQPVIMTLADHQEAPIWTLQLAPGQTAVFYLPLRLVEDADDGTEIPIDIDVCLADPGDPTCPDAQDALPGQIRALDQLTWRVMRRDLGDAPDRTNHFGVNMTAYPGVDARYPTVFDPATGAVQGPAHVRPGPFHLGQRVSMEVEADIGPDQDVVNNLRPPADTSNLDRFDDGTRPNSWQLDHCHESKLQIAVFISPQAIAYYQNRPDRPAYINVWADSNRDGDWADRFECPDDPDYNTNDAFEHIVIDFPVDVLGLGVGLHVLDVPTGRVWWPAEQADDPSWVRVTLSDIVVPKQAGAPNGDGRGYATPYIMGETEDYLRDPDAKTDVGIRKQGRVESSFDPAGNAVVVATWVIQYANLTPVPANNVVIVDTLPAGSTLLSVTLSDPTVTWSQSGNQLTFNLGTLAPNAGGSIIIKTQHNYSAAQGGTLTNHATITADNDANQNNNTASATAHPRLPRVTIFEPRAGTTCATDDILVGGGSTAGATVKVFDGGSEIGTTEADDNGRWSIMVDLDDGPHTLSAVAILGSLTSPLSNPVLLIVDSTLPYCPNSLSFTGPDGHVIYPRDSSGRMDGVDPQVRLRPETTYTVRVKLCCDSPNSSVELIIGNQSILLTDPDGDMIYTGSFTTGQRGEQAGLTLIVICGDQSTQSSGDVVLIDPAGVVYDATTNTLLENATVLLTEAIGGGVWSAWPAADYDQDNPEITGADGYFDFWTPPGTYRLNVTRTGYQPYVSTNIEVIDELVIYNVPLMPTVTAAPVATLTVGTDGFSQAALEISVGDTVAFLSGSLDGHTATTDDPQLMPPGRNTAGFDSGVLEAGASHRVAFDTPGTYSYADSNNPGATALIIVSPAVPTAVALQSTTASGSAVVLPVLLALTLAAAYLLIRRRTG